jgi:hypothetical protein
VSKNIYYYSINDVCYKRAYTHADSAIRKKKSIERAYSGESGKNERNIGKALFLLHYLHATRSILLFPNKRNGGAREGDAAASCVRACVRQERASATACMPPGSGMREFNVRGKDERGLVDPQQHGLSVHHGLPARSHQGISLFLPCLWPA